MYNILLKLYIYMGNWNKQIKKLWGFHSHNLNQPPAFCPSVCKNKSQFSCLYDAVLFKIPDCSKSAVVCCRTTVLHLKWKIRWMNLWASVQRWLSAWAHWYINSTMFLEWAQKILQKQQNTCDKLRTFSLF